MLTTAREMGTTRPTIEMVRAVRGFLAHQPYTVDARDREKKKTRDASTMKEKMPVIPTKVNT